MRICRLHSQWEKEGVLGAAGVITDASTVWMEGMRRPCDTPTSTRAAATGALLCAFTGVNSDAVDHSTNDSVSVERPPHRCAAHPPGTCVPQQHPPCLVHDAQ